MDRLNESQQALAEEATVRANAVAKRFTRIYPEYEQDIESAANFGAVRAASTYIPEMNGVWGRWSGLCIRGEIQNFLGSPSIRGRRLWSDEALEAVQAEQRAAENVELDASLSYERLMGLLPEKHRQLCEMIYGQGMTASNAAKHMGYSPNHGSKIHKEAIAILRKSLAA